MKTTELLKRLWSVTNKTILTIIAILAVYAAIYIYSPKAGFVLSFSVIAVGLWIDGVFLRPNWAQIIAAGGVPLPIALYVAGLPFQVVLLISVLVVAIGLVWSFRSWLDRDRRERDQSSSLELDALFDEDEEMRS